MPAGLLQASKRAAHECTLEITFLWCALPRCGDRPWVCKEPETVTERCDLPQSSHLWPSMLHDCVVVEFGFFQGTTEVIIFSVDFTILQQPHLWLSVLCLYPAGTCLQLLHALHLSPWEGIKWIALHAPFTILQNQAGREVWEPQLESSLQLGPTPRSAGWAARKLREYSVIQGLGNWNEPLKLTGMHEAGKGDSELDHPDSIVTAGDLRAGPSRGHIEKT